MMSKTATAIPFILFLSLYFSSAFALDVVVDSRGPAYGDFPTIAEGLAAVSGIGGTVTVNPGVDGVYRETDLAVPSDVCLRSSVAGGGYVTIDAQDLGRVFYILSASDISIEGFIIANGNADLASGGGACILNTHQNLVFSHCIFTGGKAATGGGAYLNASTCSFVECEFSGNLATGTRSPSGRGGGIYTYISTLNLVLCSLEGNAAGTDGGGLYLDAQSYVTLRGTGITGNQAGGGGGGAYITGGSAGPTNMFAESSGILGNTAGGAGPDGLVAQLGGLNGAILDCTENDPMQWFVEPGAQLLVDQNAGVPCMRTSTASFPFQNESASMVVTPLGTGQGPGQVRTLGEEDLVDGTITVILNNSAGDPVNGVPPQDVWLETSQGGLFLRTSADCGGGDRFASIADVITGSGGLAGQTTISQPIFGGGSSSYPDEKCRVMTSWGPVGRGHPSHPEGLDLNLYANSPDIDRDHDVDLDDAIEMARGFWGNTGEYPLDLYWDGEINLRDVGPLIQHGGEYVGEPKTPEPGTSYTLDVVFDIDGRQTRCVQFPEFTPVTGYILLRDYDGEPIHGFELAWEATPDLPGLNVTYPEQAINYMSPPQFNVALAAPILPTGGDVILAEFETFAIPFFSHEIRLVLNEWTSVPGRPVPVIRGAQPGEFYELVPAVGEFGDVIASINTGCPPLADYGDAPDHPGGFFPTRFNTASNGGTLPGVHHLNIGQEMLGTQVTAEFGADDLLDPDGVPNLINGDAGDDGVQELFLRRIDSISGAASYWAWVKVQVTVAAEAPDQDRWLAILFDGNGDGKWGPSPYPETRVSWLDLEPGTSTTFTTWFGGFPVEAFPRRRDTTTGCGPLSADRSPGIPGGEPESSISAKPRITTVCTSPRLLRVSRPSISRCA